MRHYCFHVTIGTCGHKTGMAQKQSLSLYTFVLSALFILSPLCLKPSEVAGVMQVNSERLQCVPLAFI